MEVVPMASNYRKINGKKPLELIINSIKALGFDDTKVLNMLGVMIQIMTLPDFQGNQTTTYEKPKSLLQLSWQGKSKR
jgi:hypothetical protein